MSVWRKDDDIHNYIEKYNIPLSDAYTKYGMRRTGCFCCPYSLKIKEDLKVLWDFEPNRYKASMHWLKDVYIAQNIELPFDKEYEEERVKMWNDKYYQMRIEMLEKYRPDIKFTKNEKIRQKKRIAESIEQLSLF